MNQTTALTAFRFGSSSEAIDQPASAFPARSNAIGPVDRWFALQQLAEVVEHCALEGWDGHGARPITRTAVETGRILLQRLGGELPVPEFAATPDGTLTAEWHDRHGDLVVELDGGGGLHYAATYRDGARQRGFVPFVGEIPAEIRALIERLRAR